MGVARLVRCCPGFVVEQQDETSLTGLCLDDDYARKDSGCNGSGDSVTGHVLPSLTSDESHCIRAASCDAL
ncbi:MAG TPA: hypothetical protein VIF62_21405, partial [Labilithrix sp.]